MMTGKIGKWMKTIHLWMNLLDYCRDQPWLLWIEIQNALHFRHRQDHDRNQWYWSSEVSCWTKQWRTGCVSGTNLVGPWGVLSGLVLFFPCSWNNPLRNAFDTVAEMLQNFSIHLFQRSTSVYQTGDQVVVHCIRRIKCWKRLIFDGKQKRPSFLKAYWEVFEWQFTYDRTVLHSIHPKAELHPSGSDTFSTHCSWTNNAPLFLWRK